MKAHTYYIFGRPPMGGSFPITPPLAAPLLTYYYYYLLFCERVIAMTVQHVMKTSSSATVITAALQR